MLVEAQLTIQASNAAVWSAITDVDRAADLIRGIEKVEIVSRPATGLVGLRWKETRILFGEPATVEKWITEAVEGESYTTRAESDGFVFSTTLRLTEGPDGVTLISAHDSRPQGLASKLKAIPMELFFRGVIRKHILADLEDFKAAVEKG
ncbi:MAG: SRPBCC family protein [Holophagaceae bacterium]